MNNPQCYTQAKSHVADMWHNQGEWVRCWEYWFWVTGLDRWQICMFFYNVLDFIELIISLQTDVRSRWSLDHNVTFWMGKWFILKNPNWISPACDSFHFIMSHILKMKSGTLAYLVYVYNHTHTYTLPSLKSKMGILLEYCQSKSRFWTNISDNANEWNISDILAELVFVYSIKIFIQTWDTKISND